MKATLWRCGWMHMFIAPRPTLTVQLHNFDLFRSCRTRSFWTVAWQLARFQLTRRIVLSLGDGWASCLKLLRLSYILSCVDNIGNDGPESANATGVSFFFSNCAFVTQPAAQCWTTIVEAVLQTTLNLFNSCNPIYTRLAEKNKLSSATCLIAVKIC